MSGEDDPQGIVQETEIWLYCQIVYTKTRIRIREWDTKILRDFEIETDYLIPARRPDLKKKILPSSGLCRPRKPEKKWEVRQVVKLCQRIKKKLWNMRITVIPIEIGTLGTILKGLVRGLEELEIGRPIKTI